eukprot:1208149-Prymnesium_polylepis.1
MSNVLVTTHMRDAKKAQVRRQGWEEAHGQRAQMRARGTASMPASLPMAAQQAAERKLNRTRAELRAGRGGRGCSRLWWLRGDEQRLPVAQVHREPPPANFPPHLRRLLLARRCRRRRRVRLRRRARRCLLLALDRLDLLLGAR